MILLEELILFRPVTLSKIAFTPGSRLKLGSKLKSKEIAQIQEQSIVPVVRSSFPESWMFDQYPE